jgi:hypothetical protein
LKRDEPKPAEFWLWSRLEPEADEDRMREHRDSISAEMRCNAGEALVDGAARCYVKTCRCSAPSVSGDIRLEARPSANPGFVAFAAVFTPGPRCTKCGAEWKLLEDSLAHRVS